MLLLGKQPQDESGVESMIGMCINTLPLRVMVEESNSVLDWMRTLQGRNVELRQHEATPLIEIQGWSGLQRNRQLFETVVVFENYPFQEQKTSAPGLRI